MTSLRSAAVLLACASGCQPLHPLGDHQDGAVAIEVEQLGFVGTNAAELEISVAGTTSDIVWVESQGLESNVVSATLGYGSTLDESGTVAASVLLKGKATELAVDSLGAEAVIVWRQLSPDGISRIFKAHRSEDRWVIPTRPAEAVSPDGSSASRPDVALCTSGRSVVVWDQDRGPNSIGVLSAFISGTTLDEDVSFDDFLSPNVQFSNQPKVACSPSEKAIVAWYQARSSKLEVFFAEGDANRGGFRAVDAPLRSGATAGEVSVTRSASGVRALSWREELSSGEANVFSVTGVEGEDWDTETVGGFASVLRTQSVVTEQGGVSVVFSAAPPDGDTGTYVWRPSLAEDVAMARLTPSRRRGFHSSSALLDENGRLVVVEGRESELGETWSIVASVVDESNVVVGSVELARDQPGTLGRPRVGTVTGSDTAIVAWLAGGRVGVARLSGLSSRGPRP